MDDDGLNTRNWGYYEPSVKGHLGLQLMSPPVSERDTKLYLSGRDNSVMVGPNGPYHVRDYMVSDSPVVPMDYVRDSWVHPREKFLSIIPGSHATYGLMPESSASAAHPLQMLHPHESARGDEQHGVRMEDSKKEPGFPKKRQGSTTPKPSKSKKGKKGHGVLKDPTQLSKPAAKRNVDVMINGINMDISGIPIPVCSCTGASQQCYRWGCGGWQSACCTTGMSVYPLPMSTKRRGARIAGRKMSQGAFKKVLEKLATEGYNFGSPIDLRAHWAKHGTNKFVTIR